MTIKRYSQFSEGEIVSTISILSKTEKVCYSTVKVFLYLATWLLPKPCDRASFPAEYIAKNLNISTRQTYRAIKDLIDCHILTGKRLYFEFNADPYTIEDYTDEYFLF